MTKATMTLNYDHYLSLTDMFDKSIARFGDTPMVTMMGCTLSYAEVDRHSLNLASYFQQTLNLQPKDRIAIQLPNILQYPIAVFAAWRAGLIIVNVNPLYTARELLHQMNDAGVKAIITLTSILPTIDEIQEKTTISTIIATNPTDLKNVGGESTAMPENVIGFLSALSQGKESGLTPIKLAQSDTALLQYTGGTTGLSKGAVLSHGNILANLEQINSGLGKGFGVETEVYIVPLPLYHIFAFTLTFALLAEGGHLAVLIPDPRNLDAFVEEMSLWPFTALAGLNTLFVALCHHDKFKTLDFSHLNITASGGMALNTDTANLWKSVTGVMISEGYGLTETSPTVTMNRPGEQQIGTIGTTLADTYIKLVDLDNNEVVLGEPGELTVKGPQVMQAYWNNDKETDKAFTNPGWFKTGDIAIEQDDGYFRIVDRLKDMVIVSSFNVYPNEIEDVVMSHPDVFECAVIGVDDVKSGQAVKLFIVSKKEDINLDDLKVYCRKRLTGFKVPKHIVTIGELPKSNVGKILRRELR